MPRSHPSASELINAIRDFLVETVTPQVDEHTAFHIKVACHILGILEREAEGQQGLERVEAEALSALLCEKIR
ncbi:MAG: DUF6285 domain-containing protein, partial [Ketobacteraceae bacterium]|nr:DUF6285 domain-containing protein [Ketobacteraceae bacterium]